MKRYLLSLILTGVLIISSFGNVTWAEDVPENTLPQIQFSMLDEGFRMSIENVSVDEIVDCTWDGISILDLLRESIKNGLITYIATDDSIVLDVPLDESHNGIFDDMPIFGLVLSSGETILAPIAFYSYEPSGLRYWTLVLRGLTYVWKGGRWVVTAIAVKSVSSILRSARFVKTTRSGSKTTTHYEKYGGSKQANEDFDSLHPSNIKDYGSGTRVGNHKEGTITVRSRSSDGRPTLEIKNGNNVKKIRYD